MVDQQREALAVSLKLSFDMAHTEAALEDAWTKDGGRDGFHEHRTKNDPEVSS